MQSYNRKTIRAMNKLARTERITSARVRNQLAQRLLGLGPLEAAERLRRWPIVEHSSRIERREAEARAQATEAQRASR